MQSLRSVVEFLFSYQVWLPLIAGTALAVIAARRQNYRLVWMGSVAILAGEAVVVIALTLALTPKSIGDVLPLLLTDVIWLGPLVLAMSFAAAVSIRRKSRPIVAGVITFLAGLVVAPTAMLALTYLGCHFLWGCG